MKKGLFLVVCLVWGFPVFAQSEVGPEGYKLLWLLVLLVPLAVFLMVDWLKAKRKGKKWQIFKHNRVMVSLDKDRLYYPDYLELTVKNTGNTDVDLDRPLLIFENFWAKRMFRLKGTNHNRFYPLYLVAGKTHTLQIDLNRFYGHDRKLKRFPKTKVIIYNVKGRRLGSQSLFLRKTLFKY